jgi:hypothetical protein
MFAGAAPGHRTNLSTRPIFTTADNFRHPGTLKPGYPLVATSVAHPQRDETPPSIAAGR